MSEAADTDPGGRVLSGQAVLDLSHLSAAQLAGIAAVERVGVVVVPRALAGAYAAVPTERIGATVYVADGANVRVHTGPLVVGGDGLGAADDVLVVVGVLVITTPVTGPVPRQISVVGSVIAPHGSESALGPALTGGVGAVCFYRYADGQEIRVRTGQTTLSGAGLANAAGGRDDVLVAAGQVVVRGPVTEVGYRQVIVLGQLVAPAAARDLLEPVLQVQGQSVWHRGEAPRVIMDDISLGPDFFRLLEQPIDLVVLGDLTIEAGVSESAIRDKLSDLALLGDLVAPAGVVAILQVRATDLLGTIRAADAPGG